MSDPFDSFVTPLILLAVAAAVIEIGVMDARKKRLWLKIAFLFTPAIVLLALGERALIDYLEGRGIPVNPLVRYAVMIGGFWVFFVFFLEKDWPKKKPQK